MKRVASASFTVSQLIEGPQGEQGSPGATGAVGPWVLLSKWEEDLEGVSSVTYWSGKESGAPYKNITYYNGLWYGCKSKYTRTASSNNTPPSSLTSRWEVAQNFRIIASEVIFSERGFIQLLQSQSIKVMDETANLAKMVISKSGITQYDYDESGNVTAYMRIDRGTIGYYKADGTAIWQLGAAGVINILSSNNGWVPKSLYKLGTDATAPQTAAQRTTNFTGTTYYVLTSKASTNTKELGYTQKSASVSGAAIDDGYYCSPGPPMETIKETDDDTSLMSRIMLHYVGGYLKDSLTITW